MIKPEIAQDNSQQNSYAEKEKAIKQICNLGIE